MTTMNRSDAVAHIPMSAPTAELLTFGPLRLEDRARYTGRDKTLYTFDDAQTALALDGLVLPSVREVMEHLIIPGLEGTLTPEQQMVFDDLLTSYGEWTDNSLYRERNTLYFGTRAYRFVWNGKQYDATNLRRSTTPAAHDSGDLPSGEILPLDLIAERAPALVTAVYGRPFTDLPRRLQNNAGISLPPEGIVRPTALADEHLLFGCGYAWDVSAARGTRDA
jgi:hypothetical protein